MQGIPRIEDEYLPSEFYRKQEQPRTITNPPEIGRMDANDAIWHIRDNLINRMHLRNLNKFLDADNDRNGSTIITTQPIDQDGIKSATGKLPIRK